MAFFFPYWRSFGVLVSFSFVKEITLKRECLFEIKVSEVSIRGKLAPLLLGPQQGRNFLVEGQGRGNLLTSLQPGWRRWARDKICPSKTCPQ
jgi:hypothetical protein